MNTTQSNQETFPKSTRALALLCGALPGLFLLVTSTTYLVEGEFVYDVKRLLQLCLMLVLFLAAGLNPGLRSAFAIQLARIPTWVKALLGLIIVLGIISSAVAATSAMHLAYSLLEVALLSMLVLAALVIAACRTVAGELFDQVAITLLAITAIAVGIQELLGVAAALANELEFFFRLSLMYYSWPRFYNQVQAWTLPVLAALPMIWSRSRSDLLRSTWFQAMVCLGALALHWYIILMTGSRGVALSLVLSFLICLLVFPATRRPSLRSHLPGLALGAILFFAVVQINQTAGGEDAPVPAAGDTSASQSDSPNPDDWYSKDESESRFADQSMASRLSLDSSGRASMWRGSLRDIKAHPILGNGPMNYACKGPMYRAGHPHSFALQFAGEWGLVTAAALIAVLGSVVLALWRRQRRPDICRYEKGTQALLIIGLVAAGGYSFLSGVMVMPASQVAGILIGGWLMGLIPATEQFVLRGAIATRVLVSAGVLISAIVTLFSLSEAGQREYRETVIPKLDQGIPRYWQQGKLCKYFDEF